MNLSKRIRAKGLLVDSHKAFSAGQYSKAESMIREALHLAEISEDKNIAASASHDLGTILTAMGRYSEALEVYSNALALKESLGESELSIASTLNQLAQVYSATGQLNQAEHLYEQALLVAEKAGLTHEKAITLSNLATVYMHQGRFSEAEALYRKVLEIQEMVGDWRAATTLNNLGNVYFAMHDLGKAHNAFQRSASQMEAQLGPDHPDTASVINNLSRVLAEEGDEEEAARMFKKSLEVLKRTLGDKHPYVERLSEREISLTKGSKGRS